MFVSGAPGVWAADCGAGFFPGNRCSGGGDSEDEREPAGSVRGISIVPGGGLPRLRAGKLDAAGATNLAGGGVAARLPDSSAGGAWLGRSIVSGGAGTRAV